MVVILHAPSNLPIDMGSLNANLKLILGPSPVHR